MAASMTRSARYLSRSFYALAFARLNPRRLQVLKVVRNHHGYKCVGRETAELGRHTCHQRICEPHSTVAALSCSTSRQFHTSRTRFDDIKIVNTPAFADSITEGDVRWDKAVGDSVDEDDVVGEIETDKTSLPIHSPAAGVIEELLVDDGDTVTAGQAIFKLRLGGAPAAKTAAPPPAAEAAPSAAAAPSSGSIPTTPPPPPPIPTKPISITPISSIPVKQYEPVMSGASSDNLISTGRTEQRVKINRMRLRIAQRLKEAQNTCAMLTTFNEIDMSNTMQLRKQYKDEFLKKHGVKIGFMSTFLKASSYALTDQPVVNAVIDESEIVYRDYVDISIAVATPKGLVVPVLRNVEKMNYAEIELGLIELGEKARTGKLAIEDMDGGTFTISNGGVFGSMFGTPIINPPQSAILGMHGIFERPMAINGKVEIRPMMYVALTYDHRLVDGREAVTFLREIKLAIEDPRIMLMAL